MFGGKQKQKLPPIVDQYLMMPAHKLSKLIKDGTVSLVRVMFWLPDGGSRCERRALN